LFKQSKKIKSIFTTEIALNKARQSQFPALEQTKGAGKREKSLAAATD
jgi:hypothetical protein